jgi:hypothetical protein
VFTWYNLLKSKDIISRESIDEMKKPDDAEDGGDSEA